MQLVGFDNSTRLFDVAILTKLSNCSLSLWGILFIYDLVRQVIIQPLTFDMLHTYQMSMIKAHDLQKCGKRLIPTAGKCGFL